MSKFEAGEIKRVKSYWRPKNGRFDKIENFIWIFGVFLSGILLGMNIENFIALHIKK